MRNDGELTTAEAASRLRVATKTVTRWVRDALEGQPSRLSANECRKDELKGLYYVDEEAVQRLEAIKLGRDAKGA